MRRISSRRSSGQRGEGARLRRQGQRKAAQSILEAAQADANLLRKVTQHCSGIGWRR
jgi:hypothetical protein